MPLPPSIQTYHCLCTSLLFATTHTLSSLPRRKPPTPDSFTDGAIILPLPSSPPDLTRQDSTSHDQEEGSSGKAKEAGDDAGIPSQGYTILLGLQADRKNTIIRREDGFEKRLLYRCGRCRLVVGYEVVNGSSAGIEGGGAMDVDGVEGSGLEEVYQGKVIYILPAGVMSTELMAKGGVIEGGKRIGESDLGITGRSVAVFE